MSRSTRRGHQGRVTPKGTRTGPTQPTRKPPPAARPPTPGTDGRVHGPRRGFVPPSTNRTGYRGNR